MVFGQITLHFTLSTFNLNRHIIMKTKNIINIIKDILIKSCIYFTAVTIAFTFIALLIAQDIFTPYTCYMFALAALGAGIAVQVFKIKQLPAVSRHIAFFILLYLDFIIVVILIKKYAASPNTTFYLSVLFVVVYLAVLGIVTGIKAAVNSARNKKSKYEKQFKNIDTEKDGANKND